MSAEETRQPPRAPRAGDPFAGAGSAPQMDAAQDADTGKGKKKRKKGRTFFLVLLFTGAALALATVLLTLTGRNLIVTFYKDFTVQRGIPEALAADVPVEEARALIRSLDAFFDRAGRRRLTDDQVLDMIQHIEAVMADRVITRDEAAELTRLSTLAPDQGGG